MRRFRVNRTALIGTLKHGSSGIMKTLNELFAIAAVVAALPNMPFALQAAESESEFSSHVFDLGVVVSDIEKSVQFYTEAIGFKEVQGFRVGEEFAGKVGLTDEKPLDIHVLVLGGKEGEEQTRLKLMEVKGTKPKQPDNQRIHSQLGYSYITISVKDMNRAMERLKKAGVKTVSKGPQELPEGFPAGIYLTLLKDPDGNFIELVGPKKP